jgi:gamma-glutamyl:cysteine ligase YbdK (ATP-grasp superfamily)
VSAPADGRLRPVGELLDDALALARGRAHELDCADELDVLPAVLERGAGRQRARYEIAGTDALLRELTEVTGAGTAPPAV